MMNEIKNVKKEWAMDQKVILKAKLNEMKAKNDLIRRENDILKTKEQEWKTKVENQRTRVKENELNSKSARNLASVRKNSTLAKRSDPCNFNRVPIGQGKMSTKEGKVMLGT
ncbi:hypothetical protein TNCV_3138441 [Trichonephila clavipes]|nr:hypothetical protein TNCV_3138441 [Trichonephila clavipes]